MWTEISSAWPASARDISTEGAQDRQFQSELSRNNEEQRSSVGSHVCLMLHERLVGELKQTDFRRIGVSDPGRCR